MKEKYKCLYEVTGNIEDVATFLVPLKDLKTFQPLTDEMRNQMKERCDSMEMRGAFADGWLSAEAAHGIKE